MSGKSLSKSIFRGTAVLSSTVALFISNVLAGPALAALMQTAHHGGHSGHGCHKNIEQTASKSCTHEDLSEACILKVLSRNLPVRQYGDLISGLEVKFNGDLLELARWQDMACSESQLKAQAAVLAATIDAHFAGVFAGVDCFFFDARDASVVRHAHIALSASQSTRVPSVAQLANLCVISREHAVGLADLYKGQSYRQILQDSPVLEGTFSAERKELSEQLTTLKANGYDVTQAMGQFFAVEDMVRTRNYDHVSQALARTRQSVTTAVARAKAPQWQNPNTSVASSRTEGWQR